ncbi:kinase-like domain-containing protein [Phlyctochytrium arcticum]|nr:kinase-like domain-containing protein [Phlyctochytrium arcticum]
MSPPRSRLSYSEEHDQEQGHSSVSTSPGNSDVGNKSTSLPTQLATLPVPVSPGSLASKRSKSVDSDLNRRPPSPLKNTPGADKRMPTRQVVETSTIYAMHETSHTLFSPLGEPEETQGKVNQYHIIRDIGSGAYGRVVLCRNEQDQRYYACKIVSKSRLRKKFRWSNVGGNGSSHDDHLASIKKEVAILKKLSKHPNINALVEVLDDGKEDNLYMIFELCEFGPIMNLQLKESVSPFCEDLARRYFRDVVLGLEYLHSKRIIHRDLKPDNLLLKAAPPMGVVQIADFGISSMFEDGVEEPVLDDKNASPLFSPPEACQTSLGHTKQLKGYAVDVWALGITLYCLVHGRAPWQDDSILLLYDKIVKAAAEISDSLSPSLQDLLYRMLRKNPDERISLAEVKVHPWSTNNGTEPMTSTEENCVFEDPTEEEVENAFQPAMMFVTKVRTV